MIKIHARFDIFTHYWAGGPKHKRHFLDIPSRNFVLTWYVGRGRGLLSRQRTRTRSITWTRRYRGRHVKLWHFFPTTPLQLHVWNLVTSYPYMTPTPSIFLGTVRRLVFFLRIFKVSRIFFQPNRGERFRTNVTSQWRHRDVIRHSLGPWVS